MGGEDTVQFKITEVFGTVELEQQAVFDCGCIGYKTRTITKDEQGIVKHVGEWEEPLVWLHLGWVDD